MMITEAMSVFWQTLKDTWEELFQLAIVNLVWLFTSLTIVLFPVSLSGVYYVANRVAHGKTFGFGHFIEGVKKFWWRSLLWFLANILMVVLIYTNLVFYPNAFQGAWWSVALGGFWIALFAFWLTMQLYFWPLLIEQETPQMLLAWRNSAYLVLANPFYALFMISFTLLLVVVSVALTLPLLFVGMSIVALLGNNAVLTLLVKFKIIKEARPGPLS
jgi:hypothetical protein